MNDYTPVLGDLGLMRQTSKNPKATILAGTPLYIGKKAYKEQVAMSLADCKADIFALGVTFYQMIRGPVENFINNATVRVYARNTKNQLFKDLSKLLESMLIENNPK